MKKLVVITICLFLVSLSLLGQVPQAFKYQAIARDINGDILANRPISLQISILEGDENGSILYCEVHGVTTNNYGLMNLEIGKGERPSHEFSSINWSLGNLYLKMKMDENGGTDFKPMGVSPLLSVPYALYAAESGNGGSRKKLWDENDNDIYNTNSGNVGIGTQTPVSQLEVVGIITAVGGNSDEWNEAYSWGDHSLEGYLTTETDPVWTSEQENYQLKSDTSTYDATRSWVNKQGFLDEEVDPEVGANTINYLPKWDGASLVTGSIYDNGSVAIGTQTPDPSAAFEIESHDKGFLPPRLTTAERDAIPSPATGLIIYNSEDNLFQGFTGSVWESFSMGSCAPAQPPVIYGQTNPCSSLSNVPFHIDELSDALSYYWEVPPDAEIIEGQGTTNILVNFGSQGGSVRVCGINQCGYGVFQEIPIFMQPPAQPGPIFGPVNLDSYSLNVHYSINPVENTSGYNWSVPPGATITAGQGTSEIIVNFGTEGGIISVNAENDCGSSMNSLLEVDISNTAFVDIRDGHTYNIVEIGTQTWMAENLNYGVRIETSISMSDNDIVEKYCYFNEDYACEVYGALYQWNELMQYTNVEGSQGICPDGWHVPSMADWMLLFNNLGGLSIAGDALRQAGCTVWEPPNTGATNSSGFTALPGGKFGVWWTGTLTFFYLHGMACFYVSYQHPDGRAQTVDLITGMPGVLFQNDEVTEARSVRCIQD